MTKHHDIYGRSIPQRTEEERGVLEQVQADIKATPHGVLALDMRNKVHRQHLLNTFGAGDETHIYFPKTSELITATQTQHEANKGPKSTTLFELADPPTNTWMAAAKMVYCELLPDGKTAVAGGLLTLLEQATVNSINLQINDNNSTSGNPIVTKTILNQTNVYTLQIDVQGTLSRLGVPPNFTATLTVIYTPAGSTESITLVSSLTYTGVTPVQSLTVLHPNHNQHPKTNYIKIGLNRTSGQISDCDYYYQFGTSGPQPIVGVQVAGSATLNLATATQPGFDGYLVLYRRGSLVGDGACLVFPSASIPQYVTTTGTTVAWNIGPDLFQGAPWDQNQTIDLDFFLNFQLAQGGIGQVRVTSIPQQFQTPPPKNVGCIAPLSFVWGCLAAGTEVVTEEGLRAIEHVRIGDKVIRNATGDSLTVTNTWIGVEERPMIALTTESGRCLLVTDGHPLLTTDGVSPARKLKVGDQVLTIDGAETLVNIEAMGYDGKVHNLDLGTEAEREGLATDETTLIAAGFIVGDNRMQGIYDPATRPVFPDTTISEEWRLDVENTRRRSLNLPLVASLPSTF